MNKRLPYYHGLAVIGLSAAGTFSIFSSPGGGVAILFLPIFNIAASVVAWGVFSTSWARLNGKPQPGRIEKSGPPDEENLKFIILAALIHSVAYLPAAG